MSAVIGSCRILAATKCWTAAACFTCFANVRTPRNSPFVGAKLYLSAGISFAIPVSCFSALAIRSWMTVVAERGRTGGAGCATAVGTADATQATTIMAARRHGEDMCDLLGGLLEPTPESV